jgi:pyrimidine-nucleoside phosphorylase
LDALLVGRGANALGAGRTTKEAAIDPAVGIELVRKIGERVERNGVLAILHVNDEAHVAEARSLVESAYEIDPSGSACEPPPLIVERILGSA